MNDSEIRALLTVALMAALADGANDDRERAALNAALPVPARSCCHPALEEQRSRTYAKLALDNNA